MEQFVIMNLQYNDHDIATNDLNYYSFSFLFNFKRNSSLK